VGTLIGGFVARATDLVTPFWLAAAGMAVLTAVVWPQFGNEALTITVREATPAPPPRH